MSPDKSLSPHAEKPLLATLFSFNLRKPQAWSNWWLRTALDELSELEVQGIGPATQDLIHEQRASILAELTWRAGQPNATKRWSDREPVFTRPVFDADEQQRILSTPIA